MSSSTSRAITVTFGLILNRKIKTSIFPSKNAIVLLLSSTKMDLALNKIRMLICYQAKKPIKFIIFAHYFNKWNDQFNNTFFLNFYVVLYSYIVSIIIISSSCSSSKRSVSKFRDRSRGQLKGSVFNSHYTEVLREGVTHFLDSSTLTQIHTI